MTTLHSPKIIEDLKGYFVFLDTGVFITAAKSKSFVQLLIRLKNDAGCSFSTISPVQFEFTLGSESLEAYNKRVTSLKSLVDYIDPLKFLDSIPDFYVVMAKVNGQNKSQTDFLLAACLYNYGLHSNVALLTGDLKAYPDFITRTNVITVEQDRTNAIRNLGVYELDKVAYARAAQNILGD